MTKPRVRFAPSPTGPLHMGGVRTALYNYLFAKKHGGHFLLRIEDTDQNRYVPGAEQYIMDSLRWCGLQWDEGPDTDGPYGPYRQSERKDMYRQYAMQLLETGHAYYAFDTPEELEEMRKRIESEKTGNPQYDSRSRLSMKNSLTLSDAEVQQRLTAGSNYVVRFKTPENEEVVLEDIIRGTVKVQSWQLDDKVLFKSDGMPTYHLANVVDDYLMKITHVIRGEEWLPSAPLHVLLYKSFGWESSMPQFAHLPLLLKPDGNGKLSKRDGDRLGFPVFPLQWTDPYTGEKSSGYRESGYFKEAFVNMIALMGWNPGTDQELFTIHELMELFSLERVGKSGAKFDPEKAKWFNHQYLISTPIEEVAKDFEKVLDGKGLKTEPEKLLKITELMRERVNFVPELLTQAGFFFEAPENYDENFARKKWTPETSVFLLRLVEKLNLINPFYAEEIHDALQQFIETTGIPAGKLMPGLRLALVGSGTGPEISQIMAILGKGESISRIKRAAEKIMV
ncbi:MAG TPA: glutamate--tRNA ligase [Bacteroidales bacterium]|nr:glutamate--tRNA ligase [Bacteroidales bacterium]